MSPPQPTSAVRPVAPAASQAGADRNARRAHAAPIETPSSLYRPGIWRLGLLVARCLPHRVTVGIARTVAGLYLHIRPCRREIVVQNLLPALNGDRAAAERTSRRLFRNFGAKLADLWRYESGQTISHLFGHSTGWERFQAAQSSKRGVLLLTPHLGNWEFGAPILAKHGVKPLVITLDEPHGRLTKLRQASRARWNIETVVIGRDPFAFVEIIRRLEIGATVALLVDRPPATSAAAVQLFGKPFAATIAAAELARATGCALLPVCLPRAGKAYAAQILPEVAYERAALRSSDERRRLTQEIIRLFEPLIRQYLDQWYHFVPVWPA